MHSEQDHNGHNDHEARVGESALQVLLECVGVVSSFHILPGRLRGLQFAATQPSINTSNE